MMNEDEIQNELLDRLVDGELPDGDYRTLIHRLDDAPDGWRRCALSFLEQQALQRDLKQMLKEGQRFDPLDMAVSEQDREMHGAPRVTTHDRWERWLGKPWVRWTSVLAVGVLAFVGGLALQPFGSPDRPFEERVAEAPSINSDSAPLSSSFQTNGLMRQEPATLLIEDSLAGSTKPLEVLTRPINYREGDSIPKYAPEQFPQQFINAMDGATFVDQIERRVLILRMPDGNLMILPVDIFVQESPFQ